MIIIIIDYNKWTKSHPKIDIVCILFYFGTYIIRVILLNSKAYILKTKINKKMPFFNIRNTI